MFLSELADRTFPNGGNLCSFWNFATYNDNNSISSISYIYISQIHNLIMNEKLIICNYW